MAVTTRPIMDIDSALEGLNVTHNDKVQQVDKIVVNRNRGGQTET